MVKGCGYEIRKEGYCDNMGMKEKDKVLLMLEK